MARIAQLMGKPLMPWQRDVVDVALEVLPDGAWAYDEVIVTAPRQSGKTIIVRPVVVHRCGSGEDRHVFYTAQRREVAVRRWRETVTAIERSPLAGDVSKRVSRAAESLRWPRLDSFFAPFGPRGDDLHSETADLVVVDELWGIKGDRGETLVGAYSPTFTTRDGQVWKVSTAGEADSLLLNESRDRGRRAVDAGETTGTALFEFGIADEVDGVPVDELDDDALVEAAIACNPAKGHTLRGASVAAALRDMGRVEFLRAYGNRTKLADSVSWRLVDGGVWARSATIERIDDDAAIGLAFDVDPDRREASVSVATRNDSGRVVAELVEHRIGTQWLAGRVAQLVERHQPRAVAVNNAGAARDVADELDRAGLPLMRVQTWDYAAACVRHLDELNAGTWSHRGEPELTEAAQRVTWRSSGDRRMWSGEGEPITALTSQTLAGWAFDHAPEPEVRHTFRIR